MKYYSTKDVKKNHPFSLSKALELGLASDGGLFVPDSFPKMESILNSLNDFFQSIGTEINDTNNSNKIEIQTDKLAEYLLSPFFQQNELGNHLNSICKNTFQFELPTIKLDSDLNVLELFHGPTLAFKDVGARFLAECVTAHSLAPKSCVLVATSGDTGGAVAGAFVNKSKIPVFILFPEGKISQRQEKQLTSWGKNIYAFAVQGTFDDCQKIVKNILNQSQVLDYNFISANSINIGRLLPQMIYYAKSSLEQWQQNKIKSNFIIPSGNLGNAVAAMWARKIGMPIHKIILATNSNDTIFNYFQTGNWQPKKSVMTLANAMDVGNPSNMERVFNLFSENHSQSGQPLVKSLIQNNIHCYSVTDSEIQTGIQQVFQQHNYIFCPHSVTAYVTWKKYLKSEFPDIKNWTMVATAHPAKFESIVEPLIQQVVPVPTDLQNIINQPSRKIIMKPDENELLKKIEQLLPTAG